jgi:hypothetical protein
MNSILVTGGTGLRQAVEGADTILYLATGRRDVQQATGAALLDGAPCGHITFADYIGAKA